MRMNTMISGRSLCSVVIALLVGVAVGCNTSEPGESSRADDSNTETARQQLGESSRAYLFDGTGSEAMPSYQERALLHLANRFRMDPAKFGITPPMSNRPYPPQPPFMYDFGLSEASRWQSKHYLDKNCGGSDSIGCPQGQMAQPAAFNSCCDLEINNGQAQCTGGKVKCDADEATSEEERWNLLVRGEATANSERGIGQELEAARAGNNPGLAAEFLVQPAAQLFMGARPNALGIGQVRDRLKPSECEACSKGTCTNPANGNTICDEENNPTCSGLCQGPECDGQCMTVNEETGDKEPLQCNLPGSDCKRENYPVGYYVNILQGRTEAPRPVLLDGIHLKLGYVNQMNPFGATPPGELPEDPPFGRTPPKEMAFATHYYAPSGPAQSANLVLDGSCQPLDAVDKNPNSPVPSDAGASPMADAGDTGGGQSRYIGLRYETETSISPGCHRYVFSVQDADGFVHTYPSHGSLGVRVQRIEKSSDGQTTVYHMPAPPNDSCPIWSPDRPDTSCLPDATECAPGQTRTCYTGRDLTRGQGICKTGTETCEDGRWSGVCKNQVLPEPEEICGDGKDNNCNGRVDEQCESSGGGTDAGNSPDDATSSTDATPGDGSGDAAGPSDTRGAMSDSDPGTPAEPGQDASGTPGANGPDTGTTSPVPGSGDDTDDDDDSAGCACSGADGGPVGWPSALVFLCVFGLARLRRRFDR